jgi:hypothetical protein
MLFIIIETDPRFSLACVAMHGLVTPMKRITVCIHLINSY